MKFKLVKSEEITQQLLDEHSAWAQYYDPDDVESLVELEYDRSNVVKQLENVGWSDNYWFPIPHGTKIGIFQFEIRKAEFSTRNGKSLVGYYCDHGHAIGLYGKSQEWLVNLNLLDSHTKELPALLQDLGLNENTLLPLEVQIPSERIKISGWGQDKNYTTNL